MLTLNCPWQSALRYAVSTLSKNVALTRSWPQLEAAQFSYLKKTRHKFQLDERVKSGISRADAVHADAGVARQQ